MRKPLESGDVVSVRTYNRNAPDGQRWEWHTVTVVNPDYCDSIGPSFTGIFHDGRFAGKTLALQTRHVRGMDDSF